MLKKFSIVLSLVAALGLGFAIATPSASFAAPQKHGNKSSQQNKSAQKNVAKKNFVAKKNVVVKKNIVVKNKFVVGRKYSGHYWYGRNRHRWRGNWYDYGVGPCWISIDGLWFWNVAACP